MDLNPLDDPLVFFFLSLVLLGLAAQGGLRYRRKKGGLEDDERDELNLVLTSALTLLALIIGFTFSMAVGRYDDRKRDEATEANAIETEYLRAGTIDSRDASVLRQLLRQYVNERIATYRAGYNGSILEHRAASKAVQHDMWQIVEKAALAKPNSVTALAASGMNELIDAQGHAAASWQNRIPLEAWLLMFIIALNCCALIGFDTKESVGALSGYLVLPVLISISFFLIADLDSTHAGLIRVSPDNLITTARMMVD
jgi:hypothetical protein